MKQVFGRVVGMLTKYKVSAAILTLLIAIFTIGKADGFDFSRFIRTQLVNVSGSVHAFWGTSYLAMGDSSYVSLGGRIADTSAFSTTLTTKAIYISGATSADVYFISKREALGVSTATPADTSVISYMAKSDSLIVMRNSGQTSGLKFSWIRAKLQ